MILHLEEPIPSSGKIEIASEFWSYYLRSVRRISTGDEITVAGTDTVAEVKVTNVEPLMVDIVSTRPAEKPSHSLHLVQALTRKKKFEQVVKLGTEIGITSFWPVLSERTVRKPNNPEKQHRRWRKIMLDSCRISGSDWAPKMNPLQPINDVLDHLADHSMFLGDSEGQSPGELFVDTDDSVLVIGPEGGFQPEEKEMIEEKGAQNVSLGNNNYRAETASLILSTLWLNEHSRYE